MGIIRLGILGTSDIAYRRFLPSLKKCSSFKYIGVASRDIKKTMPFVEAYGGIGFPDYDSMIRSDLVDAIYIPLPPALHYEWAEKALKNGKHVLLEKPFTINLQDSTNLIKKANEKGLALHENYMFQYHSQLKEIRDLIDDGYIGDIRLIKSSFGFPLREFDDFRYNKRLGGGALLDAGGYVVKMATILLGKELKVKSATTNYFESYDVDMFGSVTFENENGLVFQGSFGMDCYYQCSLDIWGSKGVIHTNRIYTAPPTLEPKLRIELSNNIQEQNLQKDDHFAKSIDVFYNAIIDDNIRQNNYKEILLQSQLINQIQNYR